MVKEKNSESVTVPVGWENPDRAKNQSDCRIRYRAVLEKRNKLLYFSSSQMSLKDRDK